MVTAQNHDHLKFIEVTGSAELNVRPDEIQFLIAIKEYWKEEFQQKTEFKDYKTKIRISEIERKLFSDLNSIGISKEDITIREAGNYWRYYGKDIMISKLFELRLYSFNKVNQIINSVQTRGIDYMRIGKLKNHQITTYRKKVKIGALHAAREKAEYMASSIGVQLGDIINIIELPEEKSNWLQPPAYSNVFMNTPEDTGLENIRTIKLRFEVKVRFEIR